MMIRLQKVIAASGLASRRVAETMIRNGEVTVNGAVVRVLGTCVDPFADHVKVNGRHVRQAEPEVFVLLHKPAGCVTTMSDPHGRPTIVDLLAGVKVRVVPVGRLDYDAEGLLLLTNNGKVAQACLHPRYHVPKTYLVKVSGLCTDEELQMLQDGVVLDDGMTAPAVVKKSGKARINSWIELTIHEGKKHQVKRMFEALGHRVVRIKRTRFGPLMLGTLSIGTARFATDAEANALRVLLQPPARVRTTRLAVSSRASVSTQPARPQQTMPPARQRKPRFPMRSTRPTRPKKTMPPARQQRPVLPMRSTQPARPQQTMPPSRQQRPVFPMRSTQPTRSKQTMPPSRQQRPVLPMRSTQPARPQRTMPPSRQREPTRPGRPKQTMPPMRPRKPGLPARRDANSGRRWPSAGKTRGTRQVTRGRRPHERKKGR